MARMYVNIADASKMAEKFLSDAFGYFMGNHYEKNDLLKPAQHTCFSRPDGLTEPYVVWKKKGFFIAGSAHYRENKIEMNLNFLTSPDAVKFIKNTVIHELAHIINRYYGGRNHDKQWKYIANLLGDDGEVFHNYAIPENKPVWRLKCKKCGKVHDVTAYRYRNYTSYRCRCDKANGELIQLQQG